jgi:muramoyltetrapeptide carboxypeptidase
MNRRQFLQTLAISAMTTQVPHIADANLSPHSLIKPSRLKAGDTVGLINPASYIQRQDLEQIQKNLTALGLKVKVGKHVLDQYGYLAGTDINRAADVNAMFADDSIQAIFTARGGWGCNRILPLLNYDQMRSHPKILMGFSDITSLLLAVYTQSGVVSFHGPVGTSTWNPFTVDYLQRILFQGEAIALQNPVTVPVQTITSGKARGQLVGGNLSVLTAMLGSAYLPSWKQTILFIEEIDEEVYRIDRLLTQLKLAGILNQISGFIFGQCTHCEPKGTDNSLTLAQVLKDHIQPLGIPAWYGSMIGHIQDKFTLPIGISVAIDATAGTIQLLESAVRV